MNHIHSFRASNEDEKVLTQLTGNTHKHISDKIDTERQLEQYDNCVVKKPWGYEYIAFDNSQVAVWILHIARKRRTSLHCHPRKTTGLIVLSGDARCGNLNTEITLNSLHAVEIDKGCFHTTEAYNESTIYPSAENGIWLMEIESPSNKHDLVRASDRYGRNGRAYEGKSSHIEYSKELLKFRVPKKNNKHVYKFMGCRLTLSSGFVAESTDKQMRTHAVIGYSGLSDNKCELLTVGRIYDDDQIRRIKRRCNISNYLFLSIEKDNMLTKLSDYVAEIISECGVKHVFSVSGGGAMHLVDSIGKHSNLSYIATHHEQAAAMAAEAYSRINGYAVTLVTTGPGGTNAVTGLAGAWVDSIPCLFLSGQVTTDTLISDTRLRQFGIQETDVVSLVKPLCKYAVTIKNEKEIRYVLEKAIYLSRSGRPGPVWVDIPLDLQAKTIDPDRLTAFKTPEERNCLKKVSFHKQVKNSMKALKQAKRPLLMFGYGVRLSGAMSELREIVDVLNIPVISSWTAADIVDSSDGKYIGRPGIFGDRASNFAIQNCDCLLVIGCRLSIPQIGYNYSKFARSASITMIDVDINEMNKASLHVDNPIIADAKDYCQELLKQMKAGDITFDKNSSQQRLWLHRCQYWKEKYPVVLPEYKTLKSGINSFYFIEELSKVLDENAIVVTDMGTSFTCTMQTFKTKYGQRLTTSSGHASMGFGLPGAIGACFANNAKKVICISGEGGLQMNIQELQTIVHHKLPIILFVINNGGYLTIKHMQQNHFGRYVGSEPSSGVSCPNLMKLAAAYGIPSIRLENQLELNKNLESIVASHGPYICEIMMPEDQPLIPRSSSQKRPDGSIVSKSIEDLYPFLPRDEFRENMIIEPAEEFE